MVLWTLSRVSPRISTNKESIIIAESSVRTKPFATRHFRTYWLFYDNNSIVVEKELLESYCVHRNSRNWNCLCTLTKYAWGAQFSRLTQMFGVVTLKMIGQFYSIFVSMTMLDNAACIIRGAKLFTGIVCDNLESSCA